MPGETHDTLAGADPEAFPRFLAREAQDADGEKPPPLPRLPRIGRTALARIILGTARVGHGGIVHGLAVACLSGLSLFATVAAEQRTQLAGVHVAPPPLVRAPREDGAGLDDVESVEEHARYGQHIQSYLAGREEHPGGALLKADALSPEADTAGELPPEALHGAQDEAVALLIVHGVPASVTFLDGAQAGIGSWAIAGQDPAELALAIKEGPGAETTASVEMMSAAGVSLATRSIAFHKAQGVGIPPSAAAPQTPAKAVRAAESSAAGEKRSFRNKSVVNARKAFKVALEERKAKRRARRVQDAYRAEKMKEQAAADEAAVKKDAASEDQPGPVGKFFNWIKGGGSSATQQAADAPEPPARPPIDESSMSGLGMFQK